MSGGFFPLYVTGHPIFRFTLCHAKHVAQRVEAFSGSQLAQFRRLFGDELAGILSAESHDVPPFFTAKLKIENGHNAIHVWL
jgi:hypothetical protein